jgi:hypothetical protein
VGEGRNWHPQKNQGIERGKNIQKSSYIILTHGVGYVLVGLTSLLKKNIFFL